MPDITIAQQIDCVQRELKYRRRVYQRLIDNGKMSREKATHEIAAMEAVLQTLIPLNTEDLFHEKKKQQP